MRPSNPAGGSASTRPSAIVTGGSAGLGRAIVTRLRSAGYDVTASGRDAANLSDLAREMPGVATFIGDAANSDGAARMVRGHVDQFGQLDVLVNVVGRSDRGRIDQMDADHLRAMLDANVIATLVCSGAAVDHLARRRGVIVNIGSLAGCVAPAYLGGYVAAKHALTGMTRQMRLELIDTGIHVGLVCPGPIRRDDAGVRYDVKNQAGVPASAAGPGGGAKLAGLPPERVADAVMTCIQKRKPQIILPGKVRFLMALDAIWPSLADRLLAKKMGHG